MRFAERFGPTSSRFPNKSNMTTFPEWEEWRLSMVHIRAGNAEDKEYIINIRPQAETLFSDKGYFIVAQENEMILGFATVFYRKIPAPITAEEAFINLIEVFEQSNRRKGIATLMVRKILQMEKEKRTYQVRAYCDINNMESHRLWLKNGFGIAPVKYLDGSILGSFVTYVL